MNQCNVKAMLQQRLWLVRLPKPDAEPWRFTTASQRLRGHCVHVTYLTWGFCVFVDRAGKTALRRRDRTTHRKEPAVQNQTLRRFFTWWIGVDPGLAPDAFIWTAAPRSGLFLLRTGIRVTPEKNNSSLLSCSCCCVPAQPLDIPLL